ncbi:nucleotidyltransferase family protein [Neotabrizicola shimadae]|uniref:Nucleotidyltransferase family protein n=1 Tax=Neotabrizicola shimadae TaxID=2807096 RepID=A0A8G1EEN9_9RHOB|nr:nucleotidyltransferase family protein [Neotabrizicola shimadae]QYZ71606.1 nucleotidyltransferase family protein [Neotabrizicola shimadae]
MTMIPILILAAGASSRMGGRDKLLEDVAGEPLLVRVAKTALATGHPVSIALATDRPQREVALAGLDLHRVPVPLAREGMSESLKAGFAALPGGGPVLTMLADLPDLQTDDLRAVLATAAKAPDMILRGAAQDGRPGHPVLLPGWLRPEIEALSGDEGARALIQRHGDLVRLVPLPANRALTDLDTPEDWEAWRATQADIKTRAS